MKKSELMKALEASQLKTAEWIGRCDDLATKANNLKCALETKAKWFDLCREETTAKGHRIANLEGALLMERNNRKAAENELARVKKNRGQYWASFKIAEKYDELRMARFKELEAAFDKKTGEIEMLKEELAEAKAMIDDSEEETPASNLIQVFDAWVQDRNKD